MSKPIYKPSKPYAEDINNLVEADELAKGRGPDKKKRKPRDSGATQAYLEGLANAHGQMVATMNQANANAKKPKP